MIIFSGYNNAINELKLIFSTQSRDHQSNPRMIVIRFKNGVNKRKCRIFTWDEDKDDFVKKKNKQIPHSC